MKLVPPLRSFLLGLALLAFSVAGVMAQSSQTTTTQIRLEEANRLPHPHLHPKKHAAPRH